MDLSVCLRPLVARTRCVPGSPLGQGPAARRGRVGGHRGRGVPGWAAQPRTPGFALHCSGPYNPPAMGDRGSVCGWHRAAGCSRVRGVPGELCGCSSDRFPPPSPPAAAGPRRGVAGAPGPPLCAQGTRGRRWRWPVPRTPAVPGPGGRGSVAGITPGASPHPSAACRGHRAQDGAREEGAAGCPSEPRGFTCTRRHPQPGQGLP